MAISRSKRYFKLWQGVAAKVSESAQPLQQNADRQQDEHVGDDKEKERQGLITFKLERILYRRSLFDSFKALSEHAIFAKIFEKEKKREMMMNMRALKFWSLRTKQKVFLVAMKGNVNLS